MPDKKKFTQEEAEAWFKNREWANGLALEADDSINAVEFAEQYNNNKEIWDMLFNWLKETDLSSLEAGKYVIVPERLWINLLEYTPKSAEETKIESHEKFIDLQYTFEGDELMGLAGKVTPTGPYDPVKDKTNYTTEEEIVYSPSTPDRFFLYFPEDMHQPSVRAKENPGKSRKVVGKIEYIKNI